MSSDSLSYQLLDAAARRRTDVARRAGRPLRACPATRILAELDTLTAAGWIREAGFAASRGGRRSTLVALAPDIRFAAVDLGASSIDVEITDGALEPIVAHSQADRHPQRPQGGARHRQRGARQVPRRGRTTNACAPSASASPDRSASATGCPCSPPIMPGWDRYPVRDLLAREHGCPVVVDNDVNIMAVGEVYGGVARAASNLLFVKIGTGIGCGIYLGGQVYRGTDGCAGDIGHIKVEDAGPQCTCGNAGCLEALFGGAALARDALAAARAGTSPLLAARLAETGELSAIDVAEGATAGDATCIGLIRDGGRRVGNVLAGLVSFINPSMIVIGGGLASVGHVLLAEIRSVVYRRSLPLATGNLPVVLSELGPRAGVVGGALLASNVAYSSAGRSAMSAPFLELSGVVKTFPGVRALDGVDLDIVAGEVHCLLGQNGAGKSTLIKILAGAHRPDAGPITLRGERGQLRQSRGRDEGRHRHHLPGTRPGRRPERGGERLPRPRAAPARFRPARPTCGGRPRRSCGRLGHADIPVGRAVGKLSTAAKQVVSMARALSSEAQLIIMDEPSAVLAHDEVANLFRLIRDLTADGHRGPLHLAPAG